MRRHPLLARQPSGKLGHGDVGLSLDPSDQTLAMRRQLAAARPPTLPSRRHRSRPRHTLRDPNPRARAHPKPARRRTPRTTVSDLAINPLAKIP